MKMTDYQQTIYNKTIEKGYFDEAQEMVKKNKPSVMWDCVFTDSEGQTIIVYDPAKKAFTHMAVMSDRFDKYNEWKI